VGEHAGGDQHAGHVRDHPTRVRDHLQRRLFDPRPRIAEIAALIERLARVTQRIVHPDADLAAVHVPLGIDQPHEGRVVARRRGADVIVFADVDQVHRVGLVRPPEPERDVVGFVADRHPLVDVLGRQVLRDQVRPETGAVLFAQQFDIRRGHVDSPVHAGPGRGALGNRQNLQAVAGRRQVLTARLRIVQVGVLQELDHSDVERQFRVPDRFPGLAALAISVPGTTTTSSSVSEYVGSTIANSVSRMSTA
jgi:hypothetical protein